MQTFYQGTLEGEARVSDFSNRSKVKSGISYKELHLNIKFVIDKLKQFGLRDSADTPHKFKSCIEFQNISSPFKKNRRLNNSNCDFTKVLQAKPEDQLSN